MGADPRYAVVGQSYFTPADLQKIPHSKLNAALERLTGGSSGGSTAFSGKGQTLGGAPAPAPGTDVPGIINVSPQVKVLLGLVAAYLVLWYLS